MPHEAVMQEVIESMLAKVELFRIETGAPLGAPVSRRTILQAANAKYCREQNLAQVRSVFADADAVIEWHHGADLGYAADDAQADMQGEEQSGTLDGEELLNLAHPYLAITVSAEIAEHTPTARDLASQRKKDDSDPDPADLYSIAAENRRLLTGSRSKVKGVHGTDIKFEKHDRTWKPKDTFDYVGDKFKPFKREDRDDKTAKIGKALREKALTPAEKFEEKAKPPGLAKDGSRRQLADQLEEMAAEKIREALDDPAEFEKLALSDPAKLEKLQHAAAEEKAMEAFEHPTIGEQLSAEQKERERLASNGQLYAYRVDGVEATQYTDGKGSYIDSHPDMLTEEQSKEVIGKIKTSMSRIHRNVQADMAKGKRLTSAPTEMPGSVRKPALDRVTKRIRS